MLLTRLSIVALAVLMLASCSKHQPPVQMMAEARAAIQAAHQLAPQGDSHSKERILQADRALQQATVALSQQHYAKARQAAQTARNLARQAIDAAQQQNHPAHQPNPIETSEPTQP